MIARILTVLLLGWAISTPAQAMINTVEVIAGVEGTSPLDAQQKAVDYAKKRAFFLTLSKLEPGRANQIAESLSTDQIYSHIRGYELVEDKLDNENPNYYLAKFRVSVSEEMVKRLLVDDSAVLDDDVNPIVVLPVLRNEDRVLLWEDDNIWRSVWNTTALEHGEGLLVMPYGDPTDVLITDSANVLGYGFDELSPIAGRYGAGEVVVAVATYVKDRTPNGIEVVLRRLGPELNKVKSLYFEIDDRNETPESIIPQATRAISDQLKEIARNYRGEQLKRLADANRIKLKAEFRRLNEWVSIKEQLGKLPRVVQFDVDRINIQTADATLVYDTTEELMLEIMRANGFFVRDEGDYWSVMMP